MNNSVEKTATVANVSAVPVKEETGIASPWITCYRKLLAMFKEDNEVEVTYPDDPTDYKVLITSSNKYKIEALKKIIKPEIKFGNVTLTIECVTKVDDKVSEIANDFQVAFNGNPFVSKIIKAPFGPAQEIVLYLLMQHEVVQFVNDNTCDYNANSTFLSEDVAREVFNTAILGPVNIGTDTKD